jgi:uncharacterized membrane protein
VESSVNFYLFNFMANFNNNFNRAQIGQVNQGENIHNPQNVNFKVVISIAITVTIAIGLSVYVLMGSEIVQNFLDQLFNS